MITEITAKEYQALDASQAMLIKVYSETCAPCKTLAPVLEEIAGELADFPIYSINFTANPEVKDIFGIRGVPTMIFMKGGNEVKRLMGLQDKANIIEQIKNLTA